MGGVRNRLQRLEGGRPCPECGGPWKPGDPIEYIIDWGDGPSPNPEPPCPRCGREREIIIDWEDVPAPLVPDYPPPPPEGGG